MGDNGTCLAYADKERSSQSRRVIHKEEYSLSQRISGGKFQGSALDNGNR